MKLYFQSSRQITVSLSLEAVNKVSSKVQVTTYFLTEFLIQNIVGNEGSLNCYSLTLTLSEKESVVIIWFFGRILLSRTIFSLKENLQTQCETR